MKDSDSMLYDCWRGLKAAEVAKFIERDFTTDLSRYAFDKTLCASCPHNTNNMMLSARVVAEIAPIGVVWPK